MLLSKEPQISKLFQVLLAVLLVILANTWSCPQGMADFQSAYRFLNQHDYEHAIQDYDQALKLDQNNSVGYYNRGLAYYSLGQYQRAIEDYDQALKLNPNYSDAYAGRGLAYNDLGQYECAIQDYGRAIQNCKQSLKRDPSFSLVYNNRGVAYRNLGQYERAIQDYDQALKLSPSYSNAYYNRGFAYDSLGQYEPAIQDYDQALLLSPDYSNAYNNRGNAYYSLGQYERAIQDYDQALKLHPNDPAACGNRGISRIELGELDEAVSDFQSKLSLSKSDEQRFTALSCLSLAYALKGNHKECEKCTSDAKALYARATEMDRSKSAWAFIYMARAQLQLGDSKTACETLTEMSENGKMLRASEKAELKALTAIIELSQGNRLLAEADMAEALKMCSNDGLVRAWSKSLCDKILSDETPLSESPSDREPGTDHAR